MNAIKVKSNISFPLRYYLLLIIVVLSCSKEEEQKSYDGDVVLETQEDVNNFGALGITVLNGNLRIGGYEDNYGHVYTKTTAISNISPLNTLTRINGDILIQNDSSLTSLEGLQNVILVEGTLSIYSLDKLQEIKDFQSLRRIGKDLLVRNYPPSEIVSVSFNNLSEIQGDIFILSETRVELMKLASIGGNITISAIEIYGMEQLSSVEGNVEIHGSINSLDNLQKIGGDLTTCSSNSFPNVQSINGVLNITRDCYPALENCEFPNLENVGGLIFRCCLENFNGFKNLKAIHGDFIIEETNIIDFLGLEKLASIGGNLEILRNYNLYSLKGLEGISSIGNDLNVQFCYFPNLDPLQNLKSVKNITISNCYFVENLNGLSNITTCEGLLITDNFSLADFCGLKPVLEKSPNASFYSNLNKYDPSKSDILFGICSN
ncbi:MAG: hypothetical protein U0W24_26450 [Bacteroidales bacterium]